MRSSPSNDPCGQHKRTGAPKRWSTRSLHGLVHRQDGRGRTLVSLRTQSKSFPSGPGPVDTRPGAASGWDRPEPRANPCGWNAPADARMLAGVVPTPDRRQDSGPRVTPALIVLLGLVLAVAVVAIRDAIRWYDRPIAGLLVDAGGSVSAVGLQAWAGKDLGLRYPDRIFPYPGHEKAGGGRTRAAEWTRAVAKVPAGGTMDAVVERDGRRFDVRLRVQPLSPLDWWLYAGSFLITGLVYASAGLLALWASPDGALSRAFAKFAITGGLFNLAIFNSHTERTLAPVFFASFAGISSFAILLLLELPTTVGWLRRSPWIGRVIEGFGS
jgi:hypothetical protein